MVVTEVVVVHPHLFLDGVDFMLVEIHFKLFPLFIVLFLNVFYPLWIKRIAQLIANQFHHLFVQRNILAQFHLEKANTSTEKRKPVSMQTVSRRGRYSSTHDHPDKGVCAFPVVRICALARACVCQSPSWGVR